MNEENSPSFLYGEYPPLLNCSKCTVVKGKNALLSVLGADFAIVSVFILGD